MAWAEGYVRDDSSHSGIGYATLYDYIDGYWSSDVYGWWATPNAAPGMRVTGSAAGYDSNSVDLSEWVYDPGLGINVLYANIYLHKKPSTGGGGTSSGW